MPVNKYIKCKWRKLNLKEIVYFKICDNEAEYEKIQQHRITKNKFINSIIKKVYHYKFIIMAKYNIIEKIIKKSL